VIVPRPIVWSNYRYGLRPLIWGAVLALGALVLDFVPLFNLLGYDFAFAIGLLAALAGVDVGHGTVAMARRRQQPLALLSLVGRAVVAGLALLVVPLLLSLANGLRVRNCNLPVGLAFYALLPVAGMLVAAPTGVLAGWLVPGRRLGRLVAFVVPVVSVLWSLLRLYWDPPVFVLDAFGGYFPGPIYDEGLSPSGRLVWFRLANLTWVACAVALVGCLAQPTDTGGWRLGWPRASRLAWWGALGSLLIGSALWLGFRAPLGFHTSKRDLTQVLSRHTQSEHFDVWSEPTGDTPEEIALVHRDLEFRYHQLTGILGAEPRTPVTVYRFSSSQSKKDLVGAGGTLYAKPWRQEFYVQAERFPASRLRHELAHVFASAFGDPLFGVSLTTFPPRLSMGLVEGLAEAADFGEPGGRSTLHQEARDMIALGQAPELAGIMGAGFSVQSGPRAYVLAGSFCRFLYDRYGRDKLRALYRSAGDFVTVYGQPLVTLEKEWRAFLETQPVDPLAQAHSKERFRRPAIFRKVCGRELAERLSEARSLLGSMPETAADIMADVCNDDPDEPAYRMDRAEALAAAGARDKALEIARPMVADETLTWPMRSRAASLVTTVEFLAGHITEAQAAAQENVKLSTDEGEIRNSLVKQRALADGSSQRTLGRVMMGDRPGRALDPGLVVHLMEQFAQEHPDEALGSYLVGRQLLWRDPKLALSPFGQACPLEGPSKPVPLLPLFVKECRRVYGHAAYLAGDLALARRNFEDLLAQASTEADRLRATDFLERVAWQAAHP
jgi:hypothetical protein